MSDIPLVVVATRCMKPPFGFVWEIRRFAHGAVIERSQRSFRTEREAMEAGQLAARILESA